MTRRSLVLDFRESDVGGAVVGPVVSTASGYLLMPSDIAALARETDHVVVLLHGFNVRRPEGRRTLLHLARNLEAAVSAVFLAVLWPGDDRLSPLSYSLEERDADLTARRLAGTLFKHVPAAVQISFVAHSLGCRVALETMRHLAERGRGAAEVVLMATAVDCDALARGDRYRAAVDTARRVHWLASTKDRVLQFAYPVGDVIAALIHGGYTRAALGRHGPSAHEAEQVPAKVAGVQVGHRGVGHGDYLPAPAPNPHQQRAMQYSAAALAGRAPTY